MHIIRAVDHFIANEINQFWLIKFWTTSSGLFMQLSGFQRAKCKYLQNYLQAPRISLIS